jgi:hypothetical protein
MPSKGVLKPVLIALFALHQLLIALWVGDVLFFKYRKNTIEISVDKDSYFFYLKPLLNLKISK